MDIRCFLFFLKKRNVASTTMFVHSSLKVLSTIYYYCVHFELYSSTIESEVKKLTR